MTTHQPYKFIDTAAALSPLLGQIERESVIAMDTEADSRHHYREQLCLIQLTLGDQHYIVDPLADIDIRPLLDLLAERELILHGGDYDLRLLFRNFGFKAARVWDSMLAAQLLGWPQFGLAVLVYAICNVELGKDHQRADWSRRPLSDEMLSYAVDDTRFLYRLRRALSGELRRLGRDDWHRQSCEKLIEAATTPREDDREEAWRIKGGKNFNGRAGALLRELWGWREGIAERVDKPPFKVANNQFLLEWARFMAEHPQASFRDLPPLPNWLKGARRASFERALRSALEMPRSQWPRARRGTGEGRFNKLQEAQLKRLLDLRDAQAAGLALDPGVLAPREALKMAVRRFEEGHADVLADTPLMDWQAECLRPGMPAVLADFEAIAAAYDTEVEPARSEARAEAE